MAQQQFNKPYFTFVKGLATEASPVTFPENSSLDESNCILNRDGSRQRRFGVDFENDYAQSSAISSVDFRDGIITTHEWNVVGGSGTTNFLVVQVADTLHYYDITADSISGSKKSFTTDLSALGMSDVSKPISATSGNGKLFVVCEEFDPFYVEYDKSGDTISTTTITLEVRDFEGVDDGLDIDENPTSLSALHKYNLYNQGWDDSKINSYYTSQSSYPANNQIWHVGKDSNGDFAPATLVKTDFGNTPAPKGRNIFNAFDINRDIYVSGAGRKLTSARPRAIAFYASRVWYAGVNADGFSAKIYYSQILEEFTNVGHCYQSADPTAEDISDLIESDGGVVNISDLGEIYTIKVVGTSLIIFASNGIWSISGGEGSGFTATSYVVDKLTSVGAISASSVVVVEGRPYYLANDGIYSLVPDQITGKLNDLNISISSIQSKYNSVPDLNKSLATAFYDGREKKIFWLYTEEALPSPLEYRTKYSQLFVFDVILEAFYTFDISSLAVNTPYIAGIVKSRSINTQNVTDTVTVGGDVVQVAADDVIVTSAEVIDTLSKIKLLTVVPSPTTGTLTFSEFKNDKFIDWETADGTGVDYTSYLETGHEILDDASRSKQIQYMTALFEKTETGFVDDGSGNIILDRPSSCYLSAKWNWTGTAAANKWTTPRQIYRFTRHYTPTGAGDTFDDGNTTVVTKNKLRGRGKSVRFRFESETGKDFKLIGWQVQYAGVTAV